VLLSNGERVVGTISLTAGKRLRVKDPRQKPPREVALSQLARLQVRIARKQVLKEWRFKEEGSPEKVFTGRIYPRLDFGLKLAFVDGRILDCTAVKGVRLYVATGDDKTRRFTIPRYMTGQVGQTAEQLVYLKEIIFAGPEKKPATTEKGSNATEPIPDKRDEQG